MARGVALLDERVPEWWERVRLAEFDISTTCRCVLGFVYSTEADDDDDPYRHGVGALGMYGDVDEQDAYGFDWGGGAFGPDDDLDSLQAEWARVIAERQTGAA
mgnify:CR=1 FL=1